MCGIAGITSNGPLPADRKATLAAMMDSICHRGPNGQNFACFPETLLGYLHLSIIDRETSNQPMYSPDGRYVVVFDGRIYNYKELRQNLIQHGERFQTQSDTEVLLRLLIREGKAAVQKLNGMFSFFFYDVESGTWIAARDPFGIKPLYYTTVGDEFIFASEIKALLCHPDVIPERDDFALQEYLTFQFCLGARTLFEGIKKIEPGHILTGGGSFIRSNECYWDASYEIDTYHTEEYYLNRLRFLIEDSVRMQLRSDAPLGAYLSGGLDSSIICTLAARCLGEGFPMFHGRFVEGPEYDESEYAKEIVESTGGLYHEVIPTENDFISSIPHLIYLLDEPVAGPGLFPQFMVSKKAAEFVKVVLGGQGGDEVFGGYARYLVGYLEQALKGAIFETQEEGRHLVTLDTIIPNLPILQEYVPLLRRFWAEGVFEDMDARYFRLINRMPGLMDCLSPEMVCMMDQSRLFEEFKNVFNRSDTKSYINKMTHFDQKTLLPALLQIEDRVSAEVHLEARAPFLDRRIVDLVTTMPPSLKFQGGRTKHILKMVAQPFLSPKILNRKDKMGFPVPLEEWMKKGPVLEFTADILLSRASLERGIYGRKSLENMIKEGGVGARPLWGALCLELWHRNCFGAA